MDQIQLTTTAVSSTILAQAVAGAANMANDRLLIGTVQFLPQPLDAAGQASVVDSLLFGGDSFGCSHRHMSFVTFCLFIRRTFESGKRGTNDIT